MEVRGRCIRRRRRGPAAASGERARNGCLGGAARGSHGEIGGRPGVKRDGCGWRGAEAVSSMCGLMLLRQEQGEAVRRRGGARLLQGSSSV